MSGMRPCHVVSSEHGVFCERGIYIRVGRLTLTYMVVMIMRISRIEVQSYRILQQLTTGILGGKLPRIIWRARPTASATKGHAYEGSGAPTRRAARRNGQLHLWLSQVENWSLKQTPVSRYGRFSVFPSNLTQHLPSLSHTTRPQKKATGCALASESFRLPYRTSKHVEIESRSRSRYSEIESLTQRIARDWVIVRRKNTKRQLSSRRSRWSYFKQKWCPVRLLFST